MKNEIKFYGSRSVVRSSLKPGAKLFDALGRTYDKMKAYLRYYVFKDAIDRKEVEVPLEFDVYGRIIKDSEGNDIQAFIKEDKAHGLRRDSSFFYDGYWEVFEMKGDTETSLRNSLGVSSLSIRNDEGKLQERKLIGKNGNLIAYDKYVWKNDLLIKVIGLDETKNYYYGKNPYEDTVIVVPSDKGYNFHKGYDGSAGMIPKRGDKYYKSYLANPYGIWSIEEDPFENTIILRTLMKNGYNTISIPSGVLNPIYYNTNWSDTLKTECRQIGRCFPIVENGKAVNGKVNIKVTLKDYSCVCENSDYSIKYSEIALSDQTVHLTQSFISLDIEGIIKGNKNRWMRNCLTTKEIQDTYNHEMQHHKNALNKMQEFVNTYIPKNTFKMREECEEAKIKANATIVKFMEEWSYFESKHENKESPKNTGLKQGERCDE